MARRLFRNRYVVLFGSLAVLTGMWNLYVALHDDGVVAGRVVGPDGAAVAGATVAFFERTLTTLERRGTTLSDGNGTFRFSGQAAHHFVLVAWKAGVGASSRTAYRRCFRGQNYVLGEPLRLEVGG